MNHPESEAEDLKKYPPLSPGEHFPDPMERARCVKTLTTLIHQLWPCTGDKHSRANATYTEHRIFVESPQKSKYYAKIGEAVSSTYPYVEEAVRRYFSKCDTALARGIPMPFHPFTGFHGYKRCCLNHEPGVFPTREHRPDTSVHQDLNIQVPPAQQVPVSSNAPQCQHERNDAPSTTQSQPGPKSHPSYPIEKKRGAPSQPKATNKKRKTQTRKNSKKSNATRKSLKDAPNENNSTTNAPSAKKPISQLQKAQCPQHRIDTSSHPLKVGKPCYNQTALTTASEDDKLRKDSLCVNPKDGHLFPPPIPTESEIGNGASAINAQRNRIGMGNLLSPLPTSPENGFAPNRPCVPSGTELLDAQQPNDMDQAHERVADIDIDSSKFPQIPPSFYNNNLPLPDHEDSDNCQLLKTALFEEAETHVLVQSRIEQNDESQANQIQQYEIDITEPNTVQPTGQNLTAVRESRIGSFVEQRNVDGTQNHTFSEYMSNLAPNISFDAEQSKNPRSAVDFPTSLWQKSKPKDIGNNHSLPNTKPGELVVFDRNEVLPHFHTKDLTNPEEPRYQAGAKIRADSAEPKGGSHRVYGVTVPTEDIQSSSIRLDLCPKKVGPNRLDVSINNLEQHPTKQVVAEIEVFEGNFPTSDKAGGEDLSADSTGQTRNVCNATGEYEQNNCGGGILCTNDNNITKEAFKVIQKDSFGDSRIEEIHPNVEKCPSNDSESRICSTREEYPNEDCNTRNPLLTEEPENRQDFNDDFYVSKNLVGDEEEKYPNCELKNREDQHSGGIVETCASTAQTDNRILEPSLSEGAPQSEQRSIPKMEAAKEESKDVDMELLEVDGFFDSLLEDLL